jgi:hypothetical protein
VEFYIVIITIKKLFTYPNYFIETKQLHSLIKEWCKMRGASEVTSHLVI